MRGFGGKLTLGAQLFHVHTFVGKHFEVQKCFIRRLPILMSSSDDSDGEEVCPLCCNELDATDLNFLPCPCGYQVCLYCYGRLEIEFESRCPACRTVYEEGSYKITSPSDLAKYVKNYTKELKDLNSKQIQKRVNDSSLTNTM